MNKRSTARLYWIDIPALVLFIALGIVVLVQFISRYLLNDSVAWTEEIARYLLIGVAYAGSVIALRKQEHIMLEIVYRRVSTASVKPLAIMVAVVSVVFHATLTLLVAGLVFEADRRMISVDLPKNIVYGFVAITLLAATAIAMRQLITRFGQDSEQIRLEIEQSAVSEEAV